MNKYDDPIFEIDMIDDQDKYWGAITLTKKQAKELRTVLQDLKLPYDFPPNTFNLYLELSEVVKYDKKIGYGSVGYPPKKKDSCSINCRCNCNEDRLNYLYA